MEVRIVEVPKVEEKREVPFVVGGVYRFYEGYRQIIRVGDGYVIVDPETGSDSGLTYGTPISEEKARDYVQKYTYVSNAYLVIPKEV